MKAHGVPNFSLREGSHPWCFEGLTQAIAQSVYQYHAASKRDCSALRCSLHPQAVLCCARLCGAAFTIRQTARSTATCLSRRRRRDSSCSLRRRRGDSGAANRPRRCQPGYYLQHRSVGASFPVLNPTDCSCPETRALQLVPWGWAGNWAGNDRRRLSERAQLVHLTAHAQRQTGQGVQR